MKICMFFLFFFLMNIRSRFRTSACLPVCIYTSSASFYKMMSVEQVGLSVTVFWTCFPPKASMTRAHPCFTQDHHKASAFFRCRNLHKGSIGKKKDAKRMAGFGPFSCARYRQLFSSVISPAINSMGLPQALWSRILMMGIPQRLGHKNVATIWQTRRCFVKKSQSWKCQNFSWKGSF